MELDVQPGLEEHLDALRAAAFKLTSSTDDAEELVQDALASALASRERLAMVGLMRPWLLQILRRRWFDLLRRRTLERRTALPARPDPSDPGPVRRALA